MSRGCKGIEIPGVEVFRFGQRRSVNTQALKHELRRRSAIEAVIGHLKTDGRTNRCRLKGALGDALNTVPVGAGHNIRLLFRAMMDLLRRILECLLAEACSDVRDQVTAFRQPRNGLFRIDCLLTESCSDVWEQKTELGLR